MRPALALVLLAAVVRTSAQGGGQDRDAPVLFAISGKVTVDDAVHIQLKNTVAELGAMAWSKYDDDLMQLFEAYDTAAPEQSLDQSEVREMLEGAKVGSEALRGDWAKKMVNAFDVRVPYDNAIGPVEFKAVMASLGWKDTGKPCTADKQGFCVTIPSVYDTSSDCNCDDASWPKLVVAEIKEKIGQSAAECHDTTSWNRCANAEHRKARGTTVKPDQHPCRICDRQELCTISEALVQYSAPMFVGQPILAHPDALPKLSLIDNLARESKVTIQVITSTSPNNQDENAKTGRRITFGLFVADDELVGNNRRQNKYCRPQCIAAFFKGTADGAMVADFPEAKIFVEKAKALPADQIAFDAIDGGVTASRASFTFSSDATELETKDQIAAAALSQRHSCARTAFKVGALIDVAPSSPAFEGPTLAETCVAADGSGGITNPIGDEIPDVSVETFATGVSAPVAPLDKAKLRGCEYANPLEGGSEPQAPLIDACDKAECCGRAPLTGMGAGCGQEGLPTKQLSKNFRAYEFMSKLPSKNPLLTVKFNDESNNAQTRNRFFRVSSHLLTCLDKVHDKAASELYEAGTRSGKVLTILDSYWTATESLQSEQQPSRHQAGTAVRFTYARQAGEAADQGKLLKLTQYVVSECSAYIQTTGYALGLELSGDAIYMDVRPYTGGNVIEAYASDGAPIGDEDFKRWIEKGRYVRHKECRRPPQIPVRQGPSYKYVARSRRARLRSARGLFGDDFCEESKEARVQEFEELWARVTAVINDNKIDGNVKEALKTCFMLCGGGLVSSVTTDVEEEKHKACSEAVHWLPVSITKGNKPIASRENSMENCHFYPTNNEDLEKAACYWGNCIQGSDLFRVLQPSFDAKFTHEVAGGLLGLGKEINETAMLFDDESNPTPPVRAKQETMAMHCTGRAPGWAKTDAEVNAMRGTLVALFGYNPHVSVVEMQVPDDTEGNDYYHVTDALENWLDQWEDDLCRDSSREFLTPYTVIHGLDRFSETDNKIAADPEIKTVSVVFFEMEWSPETAIGDAQSASHSGLLLETTRGNFLLDFHLNADTETVEKISPVNDGTVVLRAVAPKYTDANFAARNGWAGEYQMLRLDDKVWYRSHPRALTGWTVELAVQSMRNGINREASINNWEACHVAQERLRTKMLLFKHRFQQEPDFTQALDEEQAPEVTQG
jgi:hypothetical protein